MKRIFGGKKKGEAYLSNDRRNEVLIPADKELGGVEANWKVVS